MSKRSKLQGATHDRDFSGTLTQFLISYLQTCTPEGTLERILRTAGENRAVTALCDPAAWSSYAQFRSLLEATGEVLDGPATLSLVGRHIFDSIRSPEVMQSLIELGSPAAVYAALPSLTESIIPVVELRTEAIDANECRLIFR